MHDRMGLQLRTLCLCVLFSSAAFAQQNGTSTTASFGCGQQRLVGYITAWDNRPLSELQASTLTHVIMMYLNVDQEANIVWPDGGQMFNQTHQVARRYPHLKVMASIGGWNDDSMNVSMLLEEEQQRQKFRQNLIAFLRDSDMDGVELQWEYNVPTSSKLKVQNDKANYIAFLQEMRQAFDQLTPPLILVIDVAGNPDDFFFANQTEMGQVLAEVDFVNLKTYDYYGVWNYQTGPPAPLMDSHPLDLAMKFEGKYVHWTASYYGCRSAAQLSKMNLVIVLYGFYWQAAALPPLNAAPEYGLWRAAKSPFKGGVLRWRQIPTYTFNLTNPERYGIRLDLNETRYDAVSQSAYIFDEQNGLFFAFENERSIGAKVDYALSYGLGGVTLHSVNFDDSDATLLRVVNASIRRTDCVPVIAYNCTPVQDTECAAANGSCVIAGSCTGGTFLSGKCKSSIEEDVICCPRKMLISSDGMQKNGSPSSNTTSPFGNALFAAALFVAIAAVLCVLFAYKKMKNRFNANTSPTTTTTISPIEAASDDGLMENEENCANQSGFEMQIVRDSRPTLNATSTFNDLLAADEVRARWATIEQGAGTLLVNGKVLKGARVEEVEGKRELGRGHFGVVNECTFRGHTLAVKQLKATNDEEIRRALVDLKVLRMCRCRYIIVYYGYLIHQDQILICMEAMATCLARILNVDLQRKRGFPEPVIGKVAISVVRALEYLRAKQNLMHRDVKPSNILLGADGVKLCDFGISGRLKDSKAMPTNTNMGALAYLAPERTMMDKVYDIKADVWSLGVTALELACARHPFEAPDELELIAMIRKATPSMALEANGRLSAELLSLVRSCLHKEFHRRPDYRQLLESPFLKLHDRVPIDVWLWYKRLQQEDCGGARAAR